MAGGAMLWPCEVLKPQNVSWNISPRSLAAPTSVSGITQVVSTDAGIWKATFDSILVTTRESVLTFRAIGVRLEGRLNPVLVPRCAAYAPRPGGLGADLFDPVPHDDDTLFSDGTGYVGSANSVHLVASATARAVAVYVTNDYSSELEPGQDFSIGERMYRIRTVAELSPAAAAGTVTKTGDFISGEYSPAEVSVSRATTATYTGSDGLLKTAAANTLRIDYDPVTGRSLGALIENAATNVLIQSSNFANAAYSQNIGGWVSTAASTDILGPDGGAANVTKVTITTSAGGGHWSRHLLSATAGTRTISQWVYVPSGQGITNYRFTHDWQDVETGVGPTLSIFDRWVRTSSTATLAASRVQVDFNIQINGAAPAVGKYFYVCNGQEEEGSVATSYIPTTTVPLTRDYDAVTLAAAFKNNWTLTQDDASGRLFNNITGPLTFTRGNLTRDRVASFQAALTAPAPAVTTLTFRPPLREAVAAGDALEFDDPVCRMRLATDDEMDLELALHRFGNPSVTFLEDL